jgi:acyl carrier protein
MTEATQTLSLDLVLDAVNGVASRKGAEPGSITADTPLHELGLNSLESAELFTILEERSGLQLDPESARFHRTVGELTRVRVAAE